MCTEMVYHCIYSNFSGHTFYMAMYYSLLDVSSMNWSNGFAHFAFNQDVSFSKDFYKRDKEPQVTKATAKYDPNAQTSASSICQIVTSGEVLNREKLIKDKGVSLNSDGSTNNLPAYYKYCRAYSQTFYNRIIYQTVYAIIVATVFYYANHNGFGGIIDSEGHTNDYWNTMLPCVYLVVLSQ